ncbi:hypothetical protein BBJ29_009136 [Phytophthora kernoviae]|uniref:Prolyl 4-hydroxylase alpha subunit domain-containing protein n=1 Tax=Phytophthora kernoviae TaxID=325452 RepID=A0A3R7JLE5_9STRA|nr:hypothetical protein BBJ29_009136 [Phytophthora kernoviae]
MSPSNATPAASARPFPFFSVLVALVAVALTLFSLFDPSELQNRARQLVSTSFDLNATAPIVDCSNAQQYLTDVLPVKGFHVLCIKKKEEGDLAVLQVTAFKDGNAPSITTESGHTIFPRAGGTPRPPTMKDCSKGLKVPPKKRKVIVFYSMLPTGEGDPMSLHGGCPVEDGVKYSGNKWIWNKARF